MDHIPENSIKYSIHKTITTKQLLVSPPPCDSCDGCIISSKTPRLVRISVTDWDATDSSSSSSSSGEDDQEYYCDIGFNNYRKKRRRVKKLVNEIILMEKQTSTSTSTSIFSNKETSTTSVINHHHHHHIKERKKKKQLQLTKLPLELDHQLQVEENLCYCSPTSVLRCATTTTTTSNNYNNGVLQSESINMTTGDDMVENVNRASASSMIDDKTPYILPREDQQGANSLIDVNDYLPNLDDQYCFLNHDYFDLSSPSQLVYNEFNVPEDTWSLIFDEIINVTGDDHMMVENERDEQGANLLVDDGYLPLDDHHYCFLNDNYFDFRSPSPLAFNEFNVPQDSSSLILDEINVTTGQVLLDEDSELVAIDHDLGDDFESFLTCPDMNEFFQDNCLDYLN